jgi:DNA-binding MarR family transcriptional regulator
MNYTPSLENHLCFSLYSASMAINRTYKPVLDQLGITYPQYLVLNALWEEDGQTIGSIADRLGLESSTVTPLVKRLEVASLVTRTRHRSDERRVLVALTERGRELQQTSRCLGETLLARSGMEPSELMALNRDVRRLRDALASPDVGAPSDTTSDRKLSPERVS